MSAWRGFAAMPADRSWTETWARSSASTLRAVWHAGAMLCHFTVGLGAVRMRCLLVGHDDGFAREPNRLFLRCAECGRCTRGWTIETRVPCIAARITDRGVPVHGVQGEGARRPSRALHRTMRIVR
jgi:hypothetical protein